MIRGAWPMLISKLRMPRALALAALGMFTLMNEIKCADAIVDVPMLTRRKHSDFPLQQVSSL